MATAWALNCATNLKPLVAQNAERSRRHQQAFSASQNILQQNLRIINRRARCENARHQRPAAAAAAVSSANLPSEPQFLQDSDEDSSEDDEDDEINEGLEGASAQYEDLFEDGTPSAPDYSDDMVFEEDPPGHRAGFVAIIGRPNAGKSTLLNAILNQQLSIVTAKAQTTRHRITGIWSEAAHQAVFLDTPGIIGNKRDELEERMMGAVSQAVRDADALLAIVDASRRPKAALEMLQPGADWQGPPMAIVLNKADLLSTDEMQELTTWFQENSRADAVIPISAAQGANVKAVEEWVVSRLPEGPSMYPKDVLSEASERFFVAEIVRRQVFLRYREELPYQIAVQVVEFKERKPPAKCLIRAQVLVEKKRHVGLILGAGGQSIKGLSTAAREEVEEFLQRPVYLDLSVKVAEGWRKDGQRLTQLGY